MFHVGAVVKGGEIANEPQASDRSPADVPNQAIVDTRIGRDHHRAAGELTVVECEKETSAAVNFRGRIDPQREGATAKLGQSQKDGKKISGLAPSCEASAA